MARYRRRYGSHKQSGTHTREFGPLCTDEDEAAYIEIDIPYTILPGAESSYDDPGYPPEVELDLPPGLPLTRAEENVIIDYILENHDWDAYDD